MAPFPWTWQGSCFSDKAKQVDRTTNRKTDKMNKMKYLAALLIGIAGIGLQQAQATNLDLSNHMHWSTNDSNLIGTVIPGIVGNGGQAIRDAAMTNTLLNMSHGAQSGTFGDKNNPLFSRTTNGANPGGWTPATATGAGLSGSVSDGGSTLTITLTGSFQYLVVTWDGQNSGVAVFDVSSLQAGDTIVLSRYAFPSAGTHGDLLDGGANQQYLMTHWTLLNPTTAPDGGATVMLLGMALGALGMVRRYLVG